MWRTTDESLWKNRKKNSFLIDEYDKPVINHFNNIEIANENRQILHDFYEVLKDCDQYIKFIFVTGVSKIPVFSDLNHLIIFPLILNFLKFVASQKKT